MKVEGAAGKHQFIFEFPDNHAKHLAMDYYLASKVPGKFAAQSCASGNCCASLASRNYWEAL
eukprot:5468378-Lingulodinium_polyedra.AAC.1